LLKELGHGKTAKVYMCREIGNKKNLVALKLIKQEFLKSDEAVECIEREIQIHKGLKHKNITKLIGYGTEGSIVKPSGRKIDNLVYIMMEYVSGGDFYETVNKLAGMGEESGRYFMNQLVDMLSYLE